MDFRDFMTNPRSAFGRLFGRKSKRLKAPSNPTRKEIDQFIEMLLDDEQAEAAEDVLQRIGESKPKLVIAALESAVFETKYHGSHYGRHGFKSPIEQILVLLRPLDADRYRRILLRLAEASSDHVRKTVAQILGGIGDLDLVPILEKLLKDENGYVRSYVWYGVRDGVKKNSRLREAMYPLYLEQCDCNYTETTNDSAEHLFQLDRKRAAVDLASPRYLSPKNPIAHRVLSELVDHKVTLPESIVRSLLEQGLNGMVGDRYYPNEYLVAASLKALARSVGRDAVPEFRTAIDSKDNIVQEAAAEALAIAFGVDDPIRFVFDRLESTGFDGLTEPQKIVYLCTIFDGEVCNGGIAQFLGNPSGDYTLETMAALKKVGHPEAINALSTAMKLLGPSAKERDRDRRVKPFAKSYDELQAAFDSLESAFYKTTGRFRQAILLYAVDHASHFKKRPITN